MKKILLLLAYTAFCCCVEPLMAQPKGNDLRQQAQECLNKKDYTKARYLYLQAYNAFAAEGQCQAAVDCGVLASSLYHRENYYKEAFSLLWSVEQTIMKEEQKEGQTLASLRYPVTNERLLMYVKMRNPARAKEQMTQLEKWAETAKNDSIDTDLLYKKVRYYYTFGMNKQGEDAFARLIARYNRQNNYVKAGECYKELIAMGKNAGNVGMVSHAYQEYMAWNDSVQALEAQKAYNELKAQYDSSLQTVAERDASLASQRYVAIGLGVLSLLLVVLLCLCGAVLLRFVVRNRKQLKLIQTINEHNALKTKFMRNISESMNPLIDTLDGTLPAVKALKTFSTHIEELSALEDTLTETYEVEETNVAAFCEAVAAKVENDLPEGVTLSVNAPRLSVKINKEHVEKILLHLLKNATTYTPANGKIWLDFKKRGAHVQQFIVTDTGCGISEELREKLFTPFAVSGNLIQGDGLGLPICSLEAAKMNGTLALDETYAKGARFVLSLHN